MGRQRRRQRQYVLLYLAPVFLAEVIVSGDYTRGATEKGVRLSACRSAAENKPGPGKLERSHQQGARPGRALRVPRQGSGSSSDGNSRTRANVFCGGVNGCRAFGSHAEAHSRTTGENGGAQSEWEIRTLSGGNTSAGNVRRLFFRATGADRVRNHYGHGEGRFGHQARNSNNFQLRTKGDSAYDEQRQNSNCG